MRWEINHLSLSRGEDFDHLKLIPTPDLIHHIKVLSFNIAPEGGFREQLGLLVLIERVEKGAFVLLLGFAQSY